jgi:Zn-dependent protease
MSLPSHLYQSLIQLPGLLVGLTVHECAHAWSSSLLGDDFARRQGRVSLNPLRHLTPLGTLAILLLPFGWGKPVPVNLYNYRHPRRDYLLSSLAGPASNLLLVILGLGLLQLTRHSYAFGRNAAGWMLVAHLLLMMTVIINAMLALINLIPVPPLDGSKIWPCLLGRKASFTAKGSGFLAIALVVLFTTGRLDPLFKSVIGGLTAIMPVADHQVVVGNYDAAAEACEGKRYDQAEALLTRALAIDPRSAECLAARANVRAARHKWQPALDDISAAIQLAPTSAEYYKDRAAIRVFLGQVKEIQEDIAAYRRLSGSAGDQPRERPRPAGKDNADG